MGGLVARWYLDREGGAEVTRKLITMGTPHRGSLFALDKLVNGARRGLGPIQIDLTSFGRTLPGLHQLLPEYACIETPDGLAHTTEVRLPHLDTLMVCDAMRFHKEMDKARSAAYDLHPIVGFRQPTRATARIDGDRVTTYETIQDNDEGGDGTVPTFAATPRGLATDAPSIFPVADRHGSLQHNDAIWDKLRFVLEDHATPYMAGGTTGLSLRIDEIFLASEPIRTTVGAEGERVKLRVRVVDEAGRDAADRLCNPEETVTLGPFPPGAYAVSVSGVASAATRIGPVTSPILIWSPEDLA